MNKSLIIFLKVLVVILGIMTLAFLLYEPHIKGCNINATTYEIYFNDPFLAFVYVVSIAFFVGLFQVYKLLELIRRNQSYTSAAVQQLVVMKYYAVAMIGFVLISLLFINTGDPEDRPPGIMIRGFVMGVSILVVTITSRLIQRVRNGINTA